MRTFNPIFKMVVNVYPTSVCGEDLQKGEPLKVEESGEVLFDLKRKIDEMILRALEPLKTGGKCFVEMRLTKSGEYYDSDEDWVEVDLSNKIVKYGSL